MPLRTGAVEWEDEEGQQPFGLEKVMFRSTRLQKTPSLFMQSCVFTYSHAHSFPERLEVF